MQEEPNKTLILIIATVTAFLTPFMASSVNIALPAIGQEFNMNAIVLGWVQTIYLLTAAIFLLPMGRIADILGRRRIFALGIVIYTIGSILIITAQSTGLFLFYRILQGIGGSMLFSTGVAILTSVFAPAQRGQALGINVSGVYLGLSFGPVLGGFLTQQFGWRSIFFLNFILGLLVMIIILVLIKTEWIEARGERFDYIGTLIYAPMLFSLMYGFTLLPRFSGFLSITIGFLLFIVFVLWERQCKEPVFNINLFKANTVFAFSNLAALINYSATNALGFLLSLFLQYQKGFSPRLAGTILMVQPVMMTLFSPLAGRLSDKSEPRTIASLGMGLTAVGLFTFGFLKPEVPISVIVFNLIIVGLGFALFSSPNTNAVMSSVDKKFYGVGSSILATMRMLGQMFSMGLVMLIFSINMGRVKITPEYYNLFLKSLRLAFFIFTGLCVLGIYASLKRGSIERH